MKLYTWRIRSATLFILLIISVLASGVGIYHFSNINRLIKERIYTELILTTMSKAEVVETYIAGFEYEAKILSDVLATKLSNKSPNMAEITNLLSSVASRASEIAHIDLISPDGFTIASSDSSKVGDDKTKKATYNEGKKALFFNNLHLSSGGKKPAFGVAIPVVGENQQLLGIVLVDVNADRLYRILEETSGYGDFGEVFLVNKDNYIISPSKYLADTFLKKKSSAESVEPCRSEGRDAPFADAPDNVLRYKGLSGKPVLGTSVSIPERSWCLVAEIDEGKFLTGPMWRLMTLSGVTTSVSLLLFLVLTIFISQIIIKPIQLLHRAMELVSHGQFDQKVKVTSSNEIGDLARIFNSMIDQITGYHDKLEEDVRQRTSNLSAEVETRRVAEEKLKDAVDELQRINKFMMDRELRMVELKKEIEALKSQTQEKTA